MSKQSKKFSPEVRERAVRLVQEHRDEYPFQWAAAQSIAPKIGCPSAYWRHAARCRNPQLRSLQAKRDEQLMVDIQRVPSAVILPERH